MGAILLIFYFIEKSTLAEFDGHFSLFVIFELFFCKNIREFLFTVSICWLFSRMWLYDDDISSCIIIAVNEGIFT